MLSTKALYNLRFLIDIIPHQIMNRVINWSKKPILRDKLNGKDQTRVLTHYGKYGTMLMGIPENYDIISKER